MLSPDTTSSCRLDAAVIVSDSLRGLAECGSTRYWLITVSLLPLVGLVSGWAAWWLVRKHAVKEAAQHPLAEGEVHFIPGSRDMICELWVVLGWLVCKHAMKEAVLHPLAEEEMCF